MAVIINDFEVVVEPPATPANDQSLEPVAAEQGVSPQKLTPHDLDTILRQRLERALRVWAN